MSPPTDRLDLLTQPLFAHIAITGPDATPRSFPMWFDYSDGVIQLTNTTGRPQTRALLERPDAAMSVLDPTQPYRYVGAQLRLIDTIADPAGDFFYRLAHRYGLDITLDDPTDRVILRLATRKFWKQ